MRKLAIAIMLCLIVAVCLGAVRKQIVFPVETRKYLLTNYDSLLVSSAWEVDASDNWMPVTGLFNDPYFELDDADNITPTTHVFFIQDENDDLMPLL